MTRGKELPAAAPPTDRPIAHYLDAARRQHDEIAAKFNEAERGYHEAVNALPLPELMQGPVVRATDLTPIEEVEKVLGMTRGEDEATRLIKELRDYRQRRDILAGQFAIASLGDKLVAAAAWRAAFDAYEEAAAPLREKGLSDERIDALADVEGDALNALYLVPAPNLEALAAKMTLLAASAACADNVALSAVLGDILRLGDLEPEPERDDAERAVFFSAVEIVPYGTRDEMTEVFKRLQGHQREMFGVCAFATMDRAGIENMLNQMLAEPEPEAAFENLVGSFTEFQTALKAISEITDGVIARIFVVADPLLHRLDAAQKEGGR